MTESDFRAAQAAMTDEQAMAVIRAQLDALKARKETIDYIVKKCAQGCDVLKPLPMEITIANVGDAVSRIAEAMFALLEANLAANSANGREIANQIDQLEVQAKQRGSMVHLGGFAPKMQRR